MNTMITKFRAFALFACLSLLAGLAACSGQVVPTRAPTLAPSLTSRPTSTSTRMPTVVPVTVTSTPIPPTATPGIPSAADWTADLAAALDAWAANDQFSGAALVAQDEDVLLEAAYGLADRAQNLPNQVDTKFNLGSMNKMFTAVSILQLMEAGKLSLDDTLLQHLPDYPNPEVAAQVTIHQLLTHTSGLGDVFTDEFIQDPHRYRSNADYLPLFVNEPLLFKPGEEFSYSNAGFVVLGLIIEKVSGQSYDEYVQQHIFDPSGMADSGAFAIDANIPNLATGYTTRDFMGNELDALTSNSGMIPVKGFAAGGGYSSVEDLLRFRHALWGYKLLSAASTELLTTGKVEMGPITRYSYGFMDRNAGGERVVGHTGGAPGICSFLYMYPDSGYTVVVLTNNDDGCALVLDYLKEKPPK